VLRVERLPDRLGAMRISYRRRGDPQLERGICQAIRSSSFTAEQSALDRSYEDANVFVGLTLAVLHGQKSNYSYLPWFALQI
jgi:hypothetical protein